MEIALSIRVPEEMKSNLQLAAKATGPVGRLPRPAGDWGVSQTDVRGTLLSKLMGRRPWPRFVGVVTIGHASDGEGQIRVCFAAPRELGPLRFETRQGPGPTLRRNLMEKGGKRGISKGGRGHLWGNPWRVEASFLGGTLRE